MAAPSNPSTPKSQAGQQGSSNPPAGSWRHPRLDEITRRQNASTFNERNIRTVMWNLAFLFVTFRMPGLVQNLPVVRALLSPIAPYSSYALTLLRVLIFYNILAATLPLIRRKDDLADIPLTPSQRALLGLDPSSRPATPGSQYITPPRYQRSSTPNSSGNLRGISPVSGRESPTGVGSPFSPSNSPLWQKAVGGNVTRRLSYGSNSSLSQLVSEKSASSFSTPSTPTPGAGKNASVGLSSRWLYEKGRANSGS